MDDAKAFGKRLLEVRCWRDLTLREAAGLAGLSLLILGPGRTRRETGDLEAMATALRVHPSELTHNPAPVPAEPSRIREVVSLVHGG